MGLRMMMFYALVLEAEGWGEGIEAWLWYWAFSNFRTVPTRAVALRRDA